MRRATIALLLVAMMCGGTFAQTADRLVERALGAREDGDFQRAVGLLERALDVADHDEQYRVKYYLGTLSTNWEQASRLYREVIGASPGSEWAKRSRLEIAKTEYALGNYRTAQTQLDNGDVCDSSREACYFTGLSALMANEPDAARDAFRRVDRGRYRAWALLAMGEMDWDADERAEACAKFQALAEAEISPVAMYRYGECLEHQGQVNAARRQYADLVSQFRDTPEAVRAREKLQRMTETAEVDVRSSTAVEDETPTPMTGGPKFTVQFGSFRDRANAIKLQGKIKKIYPAVRVDTELVRFREYHRVRYGYFPSRDDADRKGAEMSRELNENYTIMAVP